MEHFIQHQIKFDLLSFRNSAFLFLLTLANLTTYVEANNDDTTVGFVDKATLLCSTGIVLTNLCKSKNTKKRKCTDINNSTTNKRGPYKQNYSPEDIRDACLSFCMSKEIYLKHWHKSMECPIKLRTLACRWTNCGLSDLKYKDGVTNEMAAKVYDEWYSKNEEKKWIS